ncbi:hypothetical protein QN277_028145 [Acacia crassicarpa]|uniref:Uncharacterized protein n=1 Tax=Acacia crassicarpa TaxID=499986 RepID=A0AAE1J6M6_9FABA|nr:hypothetical protein QN277_028145 [Acacia crassicarpa]
MGFHVVALAKLLHLKLSSHSLRPALAWLACPLSLKLLFGLRIVRHSFSDAAYSFRLFSFQLAQIAFHGESLPFATRFQRALRLIAGRTVGSRPAQTLQPDPFTESFHTLSFLTL